MEDILVEDKTLIKWTDTEVFKNLLLKPSLAFEYIVAQYYNKYVVLILVIYGALTSLKKNLALIDVPWGMILLQGLIGALLGWIGMYIMGFVLVITARIFKGVADISQTVRVSAYSFIPTLILGLFEVIYFIFFRSTYEVGGNAFYLGSVFPDSIMGSILSYGLLLLISLPSLYTVFLMVIGISKANEFSIGKSIATLVIPVFCLFLILIIFS